MQSYNMVMTQAIFNDIISYHSNIVLEANSDILVLNNFIKIESNPINYCLQ